MAEEEKNLIETASLENKIEYETQANRVAQLAILYMTHPELIDKSKNLYPDLWVGKTLLRCEVQALAILLVKKKIVTADELVAQYAESIDQFLLKREEELGAVITTQGVFVPDDSPLNPNRKEPEPPCPPLTPEAPPNSQSVSPKEGTQDSTSNTKEE